MTSSDQPADERTVRGRWIPLVWAAIALVAHTLFVLAAVPRLPSSVLIWFAGDFGSVGDHSYPVETSRLVSTGYVVVGIIAVAAVVGMIADRRGAGWAFWITVAVCVVTPCLMFFVYASAAWQIGRDTPATTMSDSGGFVIMLLGAAGVAIGILSLVRPGMRARNRAVGPIV
jgi:hypothetical protein